jgi:hypothetical protein
MKVRASDGDQVVVMLVKADDDKVSDGGQTLAVLGRQTMAR